MSIGISPVGTSPIGIDKSASLPVNIVGEVVSLPVVVNVAKPDMVFASAWDIQVILSGVDVSDRVVGTVEIEIEEASARIATVMLEAAAESLMQLSGASLVINVKTSAASDWVRRFTGLAALPDINPDAGVIVLHGADSRRDVLAMSSRTVIASLVGGYWSDAVFGKYADSLDYANARLSTVPGAFDLDAYGNPRMTPWAGLAVAATLTDDVIEDGTLRLIPVSRQRVVNFVTNDNESIEPISTTAICALADGSVLTKSPTPTLSGVADPGVSVRVDIAGQSLGAVASQSGSWSVVVDIPLADGRYTPRVTLSIGGASCSMWGTPFRVSRNGTGDGYIGQAATEKVMDASFEYRYPRLHEYRRSWNWSMGISYGEYVRGHNGKPYRLPEKSLFKSAVQQSGWLLRSESYAAPLQGSQYVGYVDNAGNVISGPVPSTGVSAVLTYKNDYTGPAADDPRCEAAALVASKRIVQALTERYRITVSAPDSVAALGQLKAQGRQANLDATGEFDSASWEASATMLPDIGAASVDLLSMPGAARQDADDAIAALIAIARCQILESHRATRLSWRMPVMPSLDVSKAVLVQSASVRASGKLARIIERYDIDSGSAIADVEIAISGLIGAGTAVDDPVKAPAITAMASQAVGDVVALGSCLEGRDAYTSATVGYATGAQGDGDSDYPHEVGLAVPSIPVYVADPVEREIAHQVSVSVPVDILEVF